MRRPAPPRRPDLGLNRRAKVEAIRVLHELGGGDVNVRLSNDGSVEVRAARPLPYHACAHVRHGHGNGMITV